MMTDDIEVFGQNSIRITAGDKKIYIDPFEMKVEPKDADFILITHDHYDHFSTEDIEKVACNDTVMVVPEKMKIKAQAAANFVREIVSVEQRSYRELYGLEFDTIPAYNTLKPFHPRSAGWVSYILRIDGKRIYIAGDTDLTKEAKEVRCDIALVPVGGTYTMDAKKAAELALEVCPINRDLQRCQEINIEAVKFDRGGYVYHGRVQALADAAREAGLKF